MLRNSILLALFIVSDGAVSSSHATDLHHVHLTATTGEEGAQWYIRNMECQAVPGRKEIAKCGEVYLLFLTRGSKGGSDGTGVRHIGFSVADLPAKMRQFETAGVKIAEPPLREIPGMFKLAFVEDPWGTRIEVVEDPESLGFHHILLHSSDPDATLNWYHDVFGGKRAKLKGRADSLLFGKLWLLAVRPTPREAKLAPSEGRSIDHIGFSFADLASAALDLKGQGIILRQESRTVNSTLVSKAAFLIGPDDVLIEIVQPPE